MKTKFKAHDLTHLRVGELFAFLTLVLPILNACTASGAKQKRLLEELAQTMVNLEAATS